MTKYFLSYKFSETPIETLHASIYPIVNLLKTNGSCFCNLYDEPMYQDKKFSVKQIMEHALSNMEGTTMQVTFINTVFSEGMLIEYGYAVKMGVPRLLLIKKDLKCNSPRALANHIIEFENDADLLVKLKEFLLSRCV